MRREHKRLVREQLEEILDEFSCLRSLRRPARGWLRALREALGMSGKQFARRLGVSAPWITALERNELADSVSLKTMRQAAEALDCIFVYAVIPRESLLATIRKRATSLAGKRLERVSQSMLLEQQQLSPRAQKKAFDAAVDELIRNTPKELWDDHDDL